MIEALEAHTVGDRRVFDRIAVVDICPDGRTTMARYRELCREHPYRELSFAHTSVAELELEARRWIGARRVGLAHASW